MRRVAKAASTALGITADIFPATLPYGVHEVAARSRDSIHWYQREIVRKAKAKRE